MNISFWWPVCELKHDGLWRVLESIFRLEYFDKLGLSLPMSVYCEWGMNVNPVNICESCAWLKKKKKEKKKFPRKLPNFSTNCVLFLVWFQMSLQTVSQERSCSNSQFFPPWLCDQAKWVICRRFWFRGLTNFSSKSYFIVCTNTKLTISPALGALVVGGPIFCREFWSKMHKWNTYEIAQKHSCSLWSFLLTWMRTQCKVISQDQESKTCSCLKIKPLSSLPPQKKLYIYFKIVKCLPTYFHDRIISYDACQNIMLLYVSEYTLFQNIENIVVKWSTKSKTSNFPKSWKYGENYPTTLFWFVGCKVARGQLGSTMLCWLPNISWHHVCQLLSLFVSWSWWRVSSKYLLLFVWLLFPGWIKIFVHVIC